MVPDKPTFQIYLTYQQIVWIVQKLQALGKYFTLQIHGLFACWNIINDNPIDQIHIVKFHKEANSFFIYENRLL